MIRTQKKGCRWYLQFGYKKIQCLANKFSLKVLNININYSNKYLVISNKLQIFNCGNRS